MIRYSLLIITLIGTMVWGIYVISLIDPYSIFGRFMTFFARPVVVILNNKLAGILGKFDIYTISNIPVTGFRLAVYSVPAAFFVLVGTLSLTKGRLYCNMICPVGTFLGLLSKISFYRIKFDDSACTRCGRCAIGCKSSCIDFLNHDIDVTRCVDCFNCINICQDNALSYSRVRFDRKAIPSDEGRRGMIVSTVLTFLWFVCKQLRAGEGGPKAKKGIDGKGEQNIFCRASGSRIDSGFKQIMYSLFLMHKCMSQRGLAAFPHTVWTRRVHAACNELSQEFLHI